MVFELRKCVIAETASIKEALETVNANQYGFVFTENKSGKISGLATDGDIRRGLLSDCILDDEIFKCANVDFLRAPVYASREQLLKYLDANIKFIPIINDLGRLEEIVSRDHFPITNEQAIYIRARAPVRVSFGGGGSDLTHYFQDKTGAVINSAISLYSHALMKIRNDKKVIISSYDLGASLQADNIDDALADESEFSLIQSILQIIRPDFGFELSVNSDFPIGSGLGGSASVVAAVLGCFNEARFSAWTKFEIAEMAFQAERLHLGITGGWQDQYAAVFGGFNFIEFRKEENIVNPIRIQSDVLAELEECLVLCNTGEVHNSGDIHDGQKAAMSSEAVEKLVGANVELCYEVRNHLLRGELDKFGKCLDAGWQLKRKFSDLISNDKLDTIYNGAMANGALGGKLLGAGGGGFFLFYVRPFEKFRLLDYLKSTGLRTQNFRFEAAGLASWSSREPK